MGTLRKKLIEVALPLDAINAASAREKSIRHGHPSTLHLWWARRPLAAARAVLFAQLVDDPSAWPERFPTEQEQERERQRLFAIIERLVPWEASNDERVLAEARLEIARSWARGHASEPAAAMLADEPAPAHVSEYLATAVPPLHDPFAGGGAIPLEAQRLGLRAVATDLNPVATLINKALIEIPVEFARRPPVNPDARRRLDSHAVSRGAHGLAADVRYYGRRLRDVVWAEAGARYLGPAADRADAKLIAWLWARTVPSPDPAANGQAVPLLSTYWLSQKPKSETYLEPVVDRAGSTWSFVVKEGAPRSRAVVSAGTKAGRGDFKCLLTGSPIPAAYVRAMGVEGRLSARMIAMAYEVSKGRMFMAPTEEDEQAAHALVDERPTDIEMPRQALGFRVQNYGFRTFGDLFTQRQRAMLGRFADAVAVISAEVERDATVALGDAAVAKAYAKAIAVYLAFAVDKIAEGSSVQCTWSALPTKLHVVSTFGRQALSMVSDFAEANVFGDSAGTVDRVVENVAKVVDQLAPNLVTAGTAHQLSATSGPFADSIFCTDPPYYDNIGYANLSDFFYLWLRRSLHAYFPDLFATIVTPKDQEIIAEPGRSGGDVNAAKERFESLLSVAFERLSHHQASDVPLAVYYAFKQAEGDVVDTARASTGWETMLSGLISSGFAITATWPIRTEKSGGYREQNRNALASSIVLACRLRGDAAEVRTRAELRRELRDELPTALASLQAASIAPVDLAQAAIGPGMAVYSRYSHVLEADGSPMSVRAALQLINEVLDGYLTESEGDYDADTRWAITWFEQRCYDEGPYGEAETLAKARNVAVSGIAQAGIIKSAAGKVRLLKRDELRPLDYDPAKDERPTVWEYAQHLIRNLEDDGEQAAASLLKKLGPHAETARALAYRLYNACERRKWAEEARAYNGLVIAWPELEKIAAGGNAEKKQTALDLDEDD